MKRIVNFIIILVICLLPVIGNAKTSVSYEWKLEGNAIITSKDGNYYFLSAEDWRLNTYSKEREKIASKDFSRLFYDYTYDELVNEKVINRIYELNSVPIHYNSELNEYFSIYYDNGYCHIFDKERDIDFFTTVFFDDDLEYIKKLIGYEFGIYESVLTENFIIEKIYKEGNYYLVYGKDEDGVFTGRIYDKNLDMIFEKTDENDYSFMLHIDNNKIYYLNESTYLEVYELNGELLDTFVLIEEAIDELESYENKEFEFFNFDVLNNNIVVSYFLYDNDPVNDYPTSSVMDSAKVQTAELLSLKFRLKYEVDTPAENGKINLENKIDENDREYVELDIEPNPGYTIGKVTVTDAYGGEIEVTDSKFYMPNSDVTVNVEFIKGEYLPIPDTGLSKGLTLILIGLILVGLGVYTINYVRSDKKVDI